MQSGGRFVNNNGLDRRSRAVGNKSVRYFDRRFPPGITGTQTSTGTGTQSTSTGAFDKLSPGGQKIAQSLFNSQNPPTGTKALTLDQVAGMKSHEGWGRVFKDMKADGLVQAKNLGQVVSGHANSSQSNGTATTGSTQTADSSQTTNSGRTVGSRHTSTGSSSSSRTPIVVTSGSGRSTTFASSAGRGGMGRGGGGRFASASPTHFTTAGGAPSGGGSHGGGGGHGGGHGK